MARDAQEMLAQSFNGVTGESLKGANRRRFNGVTGRATAAAKRCAAGGDPEAAATAAKRQTGRVRSRKN